jgi:hypothetical protein
MTKRITDRDMLLRLMGVLEHSNCCDFFACPGPDHKPVPMASCAQATAAWELRQYLRRNGGWCPEHEQALDQCHPPDQRPSEMGYSPAHHGLCHCSPVTR